MSDIINEMNRDQGAIPADETTTPYAKIESRPPTLVGAHYEDATLPFPNIGPMQEVAFDLGITAINGDMELSGIVFKGFNGHQLLFEQRWPARMIKERTGQPDLKIPAGTGLAIRSAHFMIHGMEPLTHIECTVVAKSLEQSSTSDGKPSALQSVLSIPVRFVDQQTEVHFPLKGTWWVIQGGDWSDQHKIEVFSQSYALDFVKLGSDNRFFSGEGLKLEEHYSWEQPVYATAGGKVAHLRYDMPDLPPGQLPDPRLFQADPRRLLGNDVVISHGNGEFSFYGHLKQASLQVNDGELIKRGTLLGYVGNSGHTPGPHLHFHLMEGPNPFVDQGLPVKFSQFEAGGQFFEAPTTIPTRMIVTGVE